MLLVTTLINYTSSNSEKQLLTPLILMTLLGKDPLVLLTTRQVMRKEVVGVIQFWRGGGAISQINK